MKLKYEKLLSNVAFNCNLRPCMMALVGPSIEFAAVFYFWSYQILVYLVGMGCTAAHTG